MIYTLANTIEVGKPVDVFVDGRKVDMAVFADTEAGLVRKYCQPLRIEGDEAAVEEVRGIVTVRPCA